ncbi:MAG: glycosyltransferase family 4 protein [Acidobacteriota bacterium]
MTAERRPLRLLFFYDRIYPEDLGGVEHRNRELAFALAERGHEITLAGWSSQEETPRPGVRVVSLGRPASFYNDNGKRKTSNAITLAWQTLTQLDLEGFDLIETANIPYLHLWPLAWRARLRRVPLLVTWYEYWGRYWRDYLGAKWPLYALIERQSAVLGARTVATSELTRARLAARRGERRGRTDILACGVDARRVLAAAREGSEKPAAAPLIYAGRLMKGKRVGLLLEAVARVEWSSGALLTVIGTGPEEAALHRMAADLELGGKVEFVGRLETSVDVWRAMGRARIAVQPSSREGFGMFPLEAMAAGLPVVYAASEESAVAELVRHDFDGLECEPTAAGLAEGLQRVLDDEALYERLASSAADRGASYGWDRIAEQTEQICYEMLGT